MQPNSPPTTPAPPYLPQIPEIPSDISQIAADNPTSFDWSDFLDFNVDEALNITFPQPEPEQPAIGHTETENSGRVRKRDPKLVCPNFLAGRVPCACPELDAMLEEEEDEESALPGKKRARAARVTGRVMTRCQVPGCEADISELKGYHKRHRVCLRCANASTVVLDGENKRYCQQCGKFHILSDFDEGRRSCRRKLERHNTRRRRKPNDSKGCMEKESEQIILADDASGDDDSGKDGICVTGQIEGKETLIEGKETLIESDVNVSTLCSALGSQNLQSNNAVSLAASGELYVEKQNRQFERSLSDCDNKSTFSSVCPAGRISFKLYDWNPAEFPRRLRHQIFEWLASMPVELEGYIRPGCTILTAFVAMPKPMWRKLLEEPATRIKDLVASPGSMLSGRGTMLVYINDSVFRVTKDAASVMTVKVKDQAPKLHYIYPTCFEAGRQMEFVACGSDLLQPKFRFLISVAGQYLTYKICVSSLCCKKGDTNSFDHQLLSIHVPPTDMDLCGPAFIEVENQSGLSNFIPIFIGDKETCAEMEILQQKFDTPLSSQEPQFFPPRPACEVLASIQAQFSDFVLDVAWLLKKTVPEQQLTSSQIQRFNCLLKFLLEKESSVILNRVVCILKSALVNNFVAGIPDAATRLLRDNMDFAQSTLAQKLKEKNATVRHAPDGRFYSPSSQNDNHSSVSNQYMQRTVENMVGARNSSPFLDDEGTSTTSPLLHGEVIMNVNHQERPGRNSSTRLLMRTVLSSRPLIMAIAAVGVCFAVCSVVLHPHRVSHIATTIRRCLFNYS